MPVLFFDATGSVIVEVKNQKKVFLYSLVSHDKTNDCIIPIADFVTSAHDSTTIAKYLLSIKSHLELNSVSIIVTDFSWALMNAVLLIFNNCNILTYLNWCYDHIYCQGIVNPHLKTLLVHCSCHTLKNVVRKSKNIKCEDNVRRAFIFCFSLLQESLSSHQFEAYLINIFNLFNQKFETNSLLYSFTYLKKEILNRKIEKQTDPDVFEEPAYLEKNSILKTLSDMPEDKIETLSSLKNDSPFKKYFDNVLKNIEIKLQKDNESEIADVENKYYCPELFNIIKSMLYILPFWSGLILNNKPELNGLTRLDNNKVENRFGDLKNNKLKNRQVMPSELASILYKHLQVKYFQHYINFNHKELKPVVDAINKKEENWNSKKKKNFNREKGYYYKNVNNMEIGMEIILLMKI